MKLRVMKNPLAKAKKTRYNYQFKRKVHDPRLPSNSLFASALGAELTRLVGQKLGQLCKGRNFEKFRQQIELQFVCHSIEAITGMSYSEAHKQLESTWFSSKNQHNKFNAAVGPRIFTQRMTELQLQTTAVECPAATNLTWLAESLHLSTIEQKLMEFAYVLASRVDCVQPQVLREIRCKTMAQAMQHLAIILDAPMADVEQCYEGPSKLYGLFLLIQEKPGNFVTLDELVYMPFFTVRWLETEFPNSGDLLTALMQPEHHAAMLADASVSRTLLDFWMPHAVADAYEVAAKNLPLHALQSAALIAWLTRCDLDAIAFSGLAPALDFETLVSATKRYCFERSCAGQPLTAPELIHTLHVAIS
jgi:hypothetical protein